MKVKRKREWGAGVESEGLLCVASPSGARLTGLEVAGNREVYSHA